MEQRTIKFCDIEIKKQKFHQHKRPTSIKDIDINKIVVYNKVTFGEKGFKYFIGYINAKIRLLCIFFLKTSAYRRYLNETKYMSFLIKGDELLVKYNEHLEKAGKSITKEFDSEPVYDENI